MPPKAKGKDKCAMTDNEGDSSDYDEESPAEYTIRGHAGLVTVSCPRKYPRELKDRKRLNIMIPEDYSKQQFLENFRRLVNVNTNRTLLKAYCVDEPHKRFRKSKAKRERHKHLAFLMDAPFAHKRLAEDFKKQYGLRMSFSFRLQGFLANVVYLTEPGKKPSTDIDKDPALHPAKLDVKALLANESSNHIQRATTSGRPLQAKKRKSLTFDEVSIIVIEGVGDGPLRSAAALEEAAKRLKHEGSVELWNYVGGLKNTADIGHLVSKVWHLQGEIHHEFFRTRASYPLDEFAHQELPKVQEWRETQSDSRVLVLSGDAGKGKTNLGEALLLEKCPAGFWFLDDPDDFREVEGLIRPEHGILVDEITLQGLTPNQIKKLFDLEKFRRVKCRHFNASIPARCRRIFCTNSKKQDFYPKGMSKFDRAGIYRRQVFQPITSDLRLSYINKSKPEEKAVNVVQNMSWKAFLKMVCKEGSLEHHRDVLANAANGFGIALATEIVENATELCEAAGLKRCEQIRFMKAVSSGPPVAGPTPLGQRLVRKTSLPQVEPPPQKDASPELPFEEDGDPFGHNSMGFDSPLD
jgi:hypothetical protein